MLKKISLAVIVLTSLGVMAFNEGRKGEKKELEERKPEMAVYEPIVVLELFTSQGCSSCPPADILLEKVKKEYKNRVYALSYHVDYWNYIGWQDPFSNPSFTKKQRKYNIKFRNRSNYTPQLVINGKEHFVGSSTAKMRSSIDKYKQIKSDNHISINDFSIEEGAVTFDYMVDGTLRNKNIRALLVLDERITVVKRGENRNRTLKNSNIVVAEKISVLDYQKQSMRFDIPKIVKNEEKISLIVLVEDGNHDITAAAKHTIKRM